MTACDATTDAVAKQVCVNYSDSCPLRYPCSPSRQGWMHSVKGLIGVQGCRQGDASTDLRPANADEYDLVAHMLEADIGNNSASSSSSASTSCAARRVGQEARP